MSLATTFAVIALWLLTDGAIVFLLLRRKQPAKLVRIGDAEALRHQPHRISNPDRPSVHGSLD